MRAARELALQKQQQPAPVKAPSAPTTKTSTRKVSGPMGTIAASRRYKTFEAPILDDGTPDVQRLFDALNRSAESIDTSTVEGTARYDQFLRHLNATVVKQIFGSSFRLPVLRMLVDGLFDQVNTLIDADVGVKVPHLGKFQRVTRKARRARNLKTGSVVEVPSRFAMKFTASRANKAYFASGVK